MVPLKFALADTKFHWLHLYDSSPKWVFKCCLKSLTWTDANSHWLHLFTFFFSSLTAKTLTSFRWKNINYCGKVLTVWNVLPLKWFIFNFDYFTFAFPSTWLKSEANHLRPIKTLTPAAKFLISICAENPQILFPAPTNPVYFGCKSVGTQRRAIC